ncbi:hypothetical protein G7059_01790 [Erysipelothrix sp. HDW6A]|nr:hypothetical protein G7059_01790 [Erysipelothrix sp. HDW6A]
MTKAELLEMASSLGIQVPSKATKQEIIDMIKGV